MTEEPRPRPGPRRKWPRWLAALAVVALLAGGIFLWLRGGGDHTATEIVAALEEQLGVRATVGAAELSWSSRSLRLRDLSLSKGQEPFLRAQSVEAVLGSGARLEHAVLHGAELRVVLRDGVAVNLPSLAEGSSTGAVLEASAARVVLDTDRAGELVFERAHVAIDLSSRTFKLEGALTRASAQTHTSITGELRTAGKVAIELSPERLELSALAPELGLHGRASGSLSLRGTLTPFALRGRVALELDALCAGPDANQDRACTRGPLSVLAGTEVSESSLALTDLKLAIGVDPDAVPKPRSTLVGRATLNETGDAVLELRTEKLELADLALPRDIELAGLASGSGRLTRAEGRVDWTLTLDAKETRVGELPLGAIGVTARSAGKDIVLDRLRVEHADRELSAAAMTLRRDDGGGLCPVGRLDVQRLALFELVRSFGLDPDHLPDAPLTGSISFSAADGCPREATLVLGLGGGRAWKQRISSGELRAKVSLDGLGLAPRDAASTAVVLERLRLQLVGGSCTLQGSISADGELDFELELGLAGLSSVSPWLAATPVRAQGRVRGTLAAPNARLSVELGDRAKGAPDAFDVLLADAHAELDACKDGAQLMRELGASRAWLVCDRDSSTIDVLAAIDAEGLHAMRGRIALTRFDLAKHLPTVPGAGLPSGGLEMELRVTAAAWDDLRTLGGSGSISRLELGYGKRKVSLRAPVAAELRAGELGVEGAQLDGDGVRFRARGKAQLAPGHDNSLAVEAQGEIPIAPWLDRTPFLSSVAGELEVTLSVQGTLQDPDLSATAKPKEVRLTLAGEPVSNVSGELVLAQRTLRLRGVRGELGGGSVSLDGDIELRGAEPTAFDLDLVAKQIVLEPEERFDVGLDADAELVWEGGAGLPVLRGAVVLSHVMYARHVQLPEAVFAVGSERMRATRPAALGLDLRVSSKKPLGIRNSFLDVELAFGGAEQHLRVLGTDAQPALLGELSVLRGRANFRGSDLSVRRARVVFEDKERIVPKLDLYAEAPARRRKGATIALDAKGSPDRFRLDLRCVPTDGLAAPTPFACGYEGDEVRCDDFGRLTALWACQAPETP